MKEIYIHIGSYKTGTTTIQNFCNSNRRLLSENGCYYPSTPGDNRISTAHHGLALKLYESYGGQAPEWYEDENSLDVYIDKYLKEISRAKENKILFSSEEFLHFMYLNNPSIAMQRLKDEFIGFNIIVIFYLREPLALAKSLYNQFLREESRPAPLRVFIDWFYCLDKRIMLPYESISIWEDVFGKENVIIKNYSKSTRDHLNDFFNIMNLPIPVCNDVRINMNIKEDDKVLDKKRVNEVFSIVPSHDIENYLSSFVLSDLHKKRNIQVMLDNINESYGTFRSKYFSHLEYKPITVFDLVSHNEKIIS